MKEVRIRELDNQDLLILGIELETTPKSTTIEGQTRRVKKPARSRHFIFTSDELTEEDMR